MSNALRSDMKLLRLNGVWVRNPDADSWNPQNNPEWTPNSGRVTTGKMTGARMYWKYKLPLVWTHIPEEDVKQILELIEDGSDYFPVSFYHRCQYLNKTVYASAAVPQGIYMTSDGRVFYRRLTVDLVEQ